jgi:hypothetical protein
MAASAGAAKKPAASFKGGPIQVHDDLMLAKEQEILTLLASQGTTQAEKEGEEPISGVHVDHTTYCCAATLSIYVCMYACMCVCTCVGTYVAFGFAGKATEQIYISSLVIKARFF